MKLKIFNDKSWNLDITRDERFFCQELYHELTNGGLNSFLNLISDEAVGLNCKGPYEVGYEVCFYRDLKYAGLFKGKVSEYSNKRTFDLCLFSEDEMIIIEAKAFEGMADDQMRTFEKDRLWVPKALGKDDYKVHLVALVSGKYNPSKATKERFDKIVTWAQVSAIFPFNDILAIVDQIYRIKPGERYLSKQTKEL